MNACELTKEGSHTNLTNPLNTWQIYDILRMTYAEDYMLNRPEQEPCSALTLFIGLNVTRMWANAQRDGRALCWTPQSLAHADY